MDVATTKYDNCDLVKVDGRVDSYTAPNLLDILRDLLKNERYKIVLDLIDVTYVSSAGLRVLIDIQKYCRVNNRGEVVLVNVPERVLDTLDLAGLVPLFNFYNEVPAAIQHF